MSLFGLLSLLPASALLNAQSNKPLCTYHYHQITMAVSGHNILVESYQPDGTGPFPLVFMLHGAQGAFTIKSADEPSTDNFGEKTLAKNCFAVVLPHYLEVIGVKSIVTRQEMTARFPELLATAELLLDDAELLPWVKGEPVFLFGESLGAYLSIALSFRRSGIRAVSEFSGGLPAGYGLNRTRVPAVLISHGSTDTLVPIAEAEALKQYCETNKIPVEIDVYPNESHFLSPSAQQKILSRTIGFFESRQNAPG